MTATPASGLVDRIRAGGDDAEDAARTLGLLIERETVRRPPGDDGGFGTQLDDAWRDRRLSPVEVEDAVDRLLDYVRETPVPLDGAVWAVTKSYRPRIVPALVDLLRRTMAQPEHENLAFQALMGVVTASPGTEHREEALAVLRDAAAAGTGRVAEHAAAYLRTD